MRTFIADAARVFAAAALFSVSASLVFAESPKPGLSGNTDAAQTVPIARISLFSSGVAYFQHEGYVAGESPIRVPFRTDDINDALKSLVVLKGAENGSPAVSYPSRMDLERELKSYSVDLSGSPSVAELLARARGEAIEVGTAGSVRSVGRILSVESRTYIKDGVSGERIVLALLTANGVVSEAIDEIDSFKFADAALDEDFRRALALIARAGDRSTAVLSLSFPGGGRREAIFGYVIGAPIWKAAYRLDLSGKTPFLQGWAIVDNATDHDWRGVELSLVSGKPVSFIQDLYSPVRVQRPVIPLAIAGAAAPRSYKGGMGSVPAEEYDEAPAPKIMMERAAPAPSAPSSSSKRSASARPESLAESGAAFENAVGLTVGDHFEYTLPAPVTLERGSSALLPLLGSGIQAERISVYTGGGGAPALGARLTNSTGMKLPAGPVTVYDEGSYAGDALIDFLSPNDSRMIAFGEDLDLRVEESALASIETTGVKISKGVLSFSKRRKFEKKYTFKNVSARAKKVIVEHTGTPGAELYDPASFFEKSDGSYRFVVDVPEGAERALSVDERLPLGENVSLLPLGAAAYLRYASSSEIPDAVKNLLSKAAELRQAWDDSVASQRSLSNKRGGLASDQARIRANLESIGRDSAEGKKYLKRLLDAESELDKLDAQIDGGAKRVEAAQAVYETFVQGLLVQ